MNPTIRFLTLGTLILSAGSLAFVSACQMAHFLAAGYLGYAIGAAFPLLSFGAGFCAHYFADDRGPV